MRDIWAFLLQTLTASGAAALLLVVKAMFRDKLSPRWQFAVWGLLGLVMLLPAGWLGRYTLVNWPLLVEAVKTKLTGAYTLTRVLAPIPLPPAQGPETVWDILFLLYAAGVLAMLLRYAVTYLRLRMALRRGTPAEEELQARLRAVAERYGLPLCRAVEVEGLSSAFLCGVVSPILALPAGRETDDMVLLHELLHRKYRDVVWGLVICLLRCLHWCNPLLWYCANRAGNDLEALCDQRVLERLEGEQRRDYGHILLSMANERYPSTPGTSSMANGGRNIGRRIQAIARFKRYPAGMGLVSVCVGIMLGIPLLTGTRAAGVYHPDQLSHLPLATDLAMASARTVACTTPAGALDTYGKALLTGDGLYRAMCAPLEEQGALAAGLTDPTQAWDPGLPGSLEVSAGYGVYQLEQLSQDRYTGWVVAQIQDLPGQSRPEGEWNTLTTQPVQVERQEGRWVVIPQGDFTVHTVLGERALCWGYEELPAYIYAGTAGDFRAELRLQKSFVVDNTVQQAAGSGWFPGAPSGYDTTPRPDAQFDAVYWNVSLRCIYLGEEGEKKAITEVGLTCAPLGEGEAWPKLPQAAAGSTGSSSDGSVWGAVALEGDWDDRVWISGGGTSSPFDAESFQLPQGYAAQLYRNGRAAEALTLRMEEGGGR